MDALTVFGFLSVAAMLVFYALEERTPYFLLAFAIACWAAALYALLTGIWPFAVIETVWGAVALRRFAGRRKLGGSQGVPRLR